MARDPFGPRRHRKAPNGTPPKPPHAQKPAMPPAPPKPPVMGSPAALPPAPAAMGMPPKRGFSKGGSNPLVKRSRCY